MTGKQLHRGGYLAMLMAPLLIAQEKPLNVTGTFTTGYYTTTTRGQINDSISFVPVGARFEIDGFYKSSDFLSFSAQPELNLGPQASEAGFQGGNGIRFHATFLRKLIPLTFRYSNIQVEDVYFGGLTQISGYSLTNRNKELGVTMELALARLPSVTIDWGTNSINSVSGIAGISDYMSSGNHVNVDGRYDLRGWVMEAFLHRQDQRSDLLAPIEGGTQFGSLDQITNQYQASVQRSFMGDAELYADAGSQSTSSMLFTLPIDLSTHYAGANLRLFQKRRFRTALRAAYSSNLASQLLEQAVSSLTGNGSTVPDQYALLPFSSTISSLSLNGVTNITLPAGFGAYVAIDHNEILNSNQNGGLTAGYTSATAGLSYAKKLSWGGISGEYGRELGHGSVTGQSGTIRGQNYRASIQKGSAGGLQLDAGVHGSDQSVHNAQPITTRVVSAEGNISDRIHGNFSGRVGGGWQWGSIINSANEFRSGGYTARAGIEHPRLQIAAALNDTTSTSLPFYSSLLTSLTTIEVLPGGLRAIPSDYRSSSLTFHAFPLRKVELSGTWSHSRQHLDGTLSNDLEIISANVTYHFRRIQMEAGFIRFNQTFDMYPYTLRTRFYVRFMRRARLL